MDSYILPGLPFLPSFQETIATAEPLSADFLKYQLSRTPAPKRFSRNANRAPRPHLDPGTPRNEGNLSLTKTGFRPASEHISHDVAAEAQDGSPRIAKRWPVPRHVSAAWAPHEDGPVDSTAKSLPGSDCNAQMSAGFEKSRLNIPVDESDDFTLNDAIREAAVGSKIGTGRPAIAKLASTPNVPEDIAALPRGHGQERDLLGNPAEKTALKRPKKRHPLPSALPVRPQRVALAGIPNKRQFSIPDDERPAKAKNQKRPRIAKNLPVDELELAEERLVLPYDAPPLSSSDEADSDPVEESPSGRVRRLRDSKEANVKHSARPIKEKQIPIRSSRKRPLTLSEFKVIKPLPATVGANEKDISPQPATGDGFEGSERLPTGRHSCPTKPRRRPRQQVTRPTLYYRALEIVESKPFDIDLNTNQGTPEYIKPIALDFATARRESRDVVASTETLPDELLVEVESSTASTITSEIVVMTIHAMDIKHGNQQHQQAMEILEAPTQPNRTQGLLHNSQLQLAEIDEDPAAVLPEMEEGEEDQDEENPLSNLTVQNPVSMEALTRIREDIKAGTTPQADDGVQQNPVQTHQQMAPPPENPFNDGKKKIPPTKKIKRQVTFSDEVKIQRVVEPESEEEYESESEEQSLEYDSEPGKSQSTDSEEEKSQQEDDDSNGSDDDADDKGDDEGGDCYPTTKLDDGLGSPELVSSKYYVQSSSPAQPHFSFHANRTEFVASIAEDDDNVEGDMILDMDEELEELSDPPSYTPQSKKYVNVIADLDDEMLIPTSRATSAERMLMPSSDGVIETDYGEEEPSDNYLAMQPRLSHTEHGATHKSITEGSDDNLNGTRQAFFGVARLSKDLQRNLADSGIAMMPQTCFAVSEQNRGAHTRSVSSPASRKIKRAKTGLTSKKHSGQALREVFVRDVPSYFTQASQALSSPLKNVQVMMRRAKTLPATQYVSESGDEEGFIISNESFRDRLLGRKRHLSLSDSVDYSEQMDLKEVLRKSNEEMGRIGVIRKRSLPFKLPMMERVGA